MWVVRTSGIKYPLINCRARIAFGQKTVLSSRFLLTLAAGAAGHCATKLKSAQQLRGPAHANIYYMYIRAIWCQ